MQFWDNEVHRIISTEHKWELFHNVQAHQYNNKENTV